MNLKNEGVACLLFGAIATIALPAFSQSSQKAAAESLFQAGNDLADRGSMAEACEKFEASQRLDPAVGTLLHLGDCYEKIGKPASAWATFREAASVAQVQSQGPRAEIANTRAKALEASLSFVTIQVPSASRIDGLSIELGGVPVPAASWGSTIPVDPGEQPVTASANGHKSWSTSITVGGQADRQTLEIPRLAALPKPVVVAPFRAESGDRSAAVAQRVTGIVIGGVGLAGLAVGAIFGSQALLKNDSSLEECRPDDPTLCSQRGIDLREQAQMYATGSTIALVAGGALAATGLVVIFSTPKDDKEVGLRQLRPMIANAGGGLTLGGAW